MNAPVKSKKTLIIFLLMSLSSLLFFQQTEFIEKGSLRYWYFILPILLVFADCRALIVNLFTKTWPILLMILLVASWGFFNGNLHLVFRLVLCGLMFAWLQGNDVVIKVKSLSLIYIITVFISIIIYFLLDINKWGIIPGTTDSSIGEPVWRISFFPNIGYTAFFSLLIFIVGTKDTKTYLENKFIVFVSLYFIVFSFVRTALISLLIYLFLKVFFEKINNKKALFIFSLLAAVIINVAIAYSAEIMEAVQSWPLVSRLLLRGEHGLSSQEIYAQIDRPWIWGQQWQIFTHSPFLMGAGDYNFNELKTSFLKPFWVEESDTTSFLIGMLAQYGLPALLLYYFILHKNYNNAISADKWACAVFPVIIFVSMHWGSIFHPCDTMFLLYFLILLRGSKAYA